MRVYIAKPDPPPVETSFLRKYSVAIILLVALALLAFGLSALTPSLMGDEWGFLHNYIRFGKPSCPGPLADARPLSSCWLGVTYGLVNTNIKAYHALGLLINLISALLLLMTLDVLLPRRATFNVAVAAIYLVFPADITRTWLAGAVVRGTALFLLAAYFMARFWRDGRWWAWFAGVVAVAISLGTYEITLGVFIALSGLAFLLGRHRTWPQRLGLLVPAFMSIGFSLWRWRWQQSVGSAFGHDVSRAKLSPLDLLQRLWLGVQYIFGKAWSITVLELQQPAPRSGRIATATSLGIVVGLVVVAILLAYWASRKMRRFDSISDRVDVSRNKIADLVAAGAVGLVIMIAGYFPIIMAVNPGVGYTTTRIHHLPSVGAALFLCAILFVIGHWLGRTPKRAEFIALAGLTPLLVVGVLGQLTVARQVREAWTDQKSIWNTLFEQAPDIVDKTQVLILLSSYGNPERRPNPLINDTWSLSRALRLMYGNDKLNASFAWTDPSRALSIDGDDLALKYGGDILNFPAAETLVFAFDRNTRELVQIKELERDGKVLLLGPDRISPTPTDKTEWRWLVAD
ncbi:MAG: DUF4407 domain-containing protein [Anaerolineae bacterium]|nr:DUF4407 domain-containing protein [Anaerolineae bacterium]